MKDVENGEQKQPPKGQVKKETKETAKARAAWSATRGREATRGGQAEAFTEEEYTLVNGLDKKDPQVSFIFDLDNDFVNVLNLLLTCRIIKFLPNQQTNNKPRLREISREQFIYCCQVWATYRAIVTITALI